MVLFVVYSWVFGDFAIYFVQCLLVELESRLVPLFGTIFWFRFGLWFGYWMGLCRIFLWLLFALFEKFKKCRLSYLFVIINYILFSFLFGGKNTNLRTSKSNIFWKLQAANKLGRARGRNFGCLLREINEINYFGYNQISFLSYVPTFTLLFKERGRLTSYVARWRFKVFCILLLNE